MDGPETTANIQHTDTNASPHILDVITMGGVILPLVLVLVEAITMA